MNTDIPAVKIELINKIYISKKHKVNALTDFSCKIKQGEIVGLLGPNGAGKTTLVKIIMGFTAPDSGAIYFNEKLQYFGHPRFKTKISEELNAGYLPESFRPNPHVTVKEYIMFLFGLANMHSKIANSNAANLLQKVGMEQSADRKISDLSKGMGQRLGLAQAFVGDPDILILDEPTSGLDPVGRSEVIKFLLEQKKNGKTIFFCSHILSEVEQVCDKIGIIVKGELKLFGRISSILTETKSNNLENAFKKLVKEQV